MIFYKCGEDPKCASFEQYWNKKCGTKIFNISFNYQGNKIDHYNEPPVYEDNSGNFSQEFELSLLKIRFERVTYTWEMMKYKDEKSLFDPITKRKTEFIFGRIKDNNKPTKEINDYEDYTKKVSLGQSKDEHWSYYLPLYGFYFLENYDDYLLYKRKKVSFLDILANIGALFSTVKFFFSLALSFYSKNFNNYKIVGNILNPPKKEIKEIDINHENLGNIASINDLDNNCPLINEQEDEKISNEDNINNNNNNDKNENNINETSSFALKKLSFYDFFINNIYSNCCKRMQNQELINMANIIMYRYLSIDYLLYNMIKLESLFIDYKWNNPLLNNIENNNMVIKLKNT